MSIEEEAISNMWEIAAIVEMMERKSLLLKGNRETMQRMKKKNDEHVPYVVTCGGCRRAIGYRRLSGVPS